MGERDKSNFSIICF